GAAVTLVVLTSCEDQARDHVLWVNPDGLGERDAVVIPRDRTTSSPANNSASAHPELSSKGGVPHRPELRGRGIQQLRNRVHDSDPSTAQQSANRFSSVLDQEFE